MPPKSSKTKQQQRTAPVEAASSGSKEAVGASDPAPTSQDGQMQPPGYLRALSKSQLEAATHPPTTCLQILAGPGSGKTRVLTSRVAWLILDPTNQLKPEDIVVVTFTNKAANEMKQRLVKLIGKERTDNLVIGTFHSVCARYLRKYGRLIALPNNFSIIDSDDAKRMLKAILKELKPDLEKEGLSGIKPEDAMSEISKAKAREIDPFMYKQQADAEAAKGQPSRAPIGRKLPSSNIFKSVMATIYRMYQEQLVDANALDFDDLLLYGVKLLRNENQVVRNIKHVLVDEFQDTNITQYELMKLVARSSQAVSIVGDPDQSIYGWRSAEIKNLDKMAREFKGTQQARLEENYRSTGAILELALKIVRQDTSRVNKGLFTSHPRGPPVVLRSNGSAQLEASFVASEIKRLIAHSGGMLTFDDFAILLRFNYLSRALEAELQANGIDSRMMGGHKFFDRMEVKDLLAYLALADNPGFTPAFIRVVNVPKRGIGEKSVMDILNLAKAKGCKPMELAERAVTGGEKIAGLKPGLKKGLADLVDAVVEIRKAATSGTPVAQLLEMLIKKINYEDYLKVQQDFESRWGNVQELITFSTVVAQNTDFFDKNQPAIPLEEILSHTLATQEDNVPSRAQGHVKDESSSDEEFEDVPIAEKSVKASPKRITPKGKAKREVIDLLSESDEDDKTPSQTVKTKARKKAKTARSSSASASPIKTEKLIQKFDKESQEGKTPSLVEILDDGFAQSREPSIASRGEKVDESDVKTPLRVFLEASILATDLDSTSGEKDEKAKPRVTLSTCHAAKGLEWPVVFIPAVEDGCYPSFRCSEPHEIAEERRLLYVAMTRAEGFLYLTHATARMQGGETQDKILSRFVGSVAKKKNGGTCDEKSAIPFCTTRPDVNESAMQAVASVTGRKLPPKETIDKLVAEWKSRGALEMERVDQMNVGRVNAFATYSSYGGQGGYNTKGVHSGATGGWNSRMSFGQYNNDNLRSSQSSHPSLDPDSIKNGLGFAPPSLGSFSTAVDQGASPSSGSSSPATQYSGFQRASSLHNGSVGPRNGSAGFGSFSGSSKSFGLGGRDRMPLIPPSRQRQTASDLPAAPSFTDSVRLKARPEDSVALARSDGTAPRPKADLSSFQQAHSQSLNSILSMLPPDSAEKQLGGGSRNSPIVLDEGGGSSSTDSAISRSSVPSTGSGGGTGKRRLGMSRRF